MNPDRHRILILVVLALLWYYAVALSVYRFRNPKLTETELLLRTPDALLFRR